MQLCVLVLPKALLVLMEQVGVELLWPFGWRSPSLSEEG